MIDIEFLLSQYGDKMEDFAKARGQRTYLEEFKKSKLAILMKEAEQRGHKTAAAQEREALAEHGYLDLLAALRDATEQDEFLRYSIRKLEFEIEVWRSKQASERMERKAYGA